MLAKQDDADAVSALPALDLVAEQELDVEKRSTLADSLVSDHDEAADFTPEQAKVERRFLWKLDLLLLTWAWFG